MLFKKCYSSCPHNLEILEEIIKKRYEYAQLLGFNTYSEYTINNNIYNTPAKVMNFLKETSESLNSRV